MNIFEHLNDEWQGVLSLLPENLDTSAFAYGALLRKREVKCASDLLRLILAYSWGGFSLRDTAAWAKETGIVDVSDVALLERFRNSSSWMGFLLTKYLSEGAKLELSTRALRVRICDVTSVARQGSTGTDWRIHAGFDLEHLRCDSLELTGPRRGDSFTGCPVKPGEVLIGDRAYGRRREVFHVTSCGADVIVRLTVSTMPLVHPDGRPFGILRELDELEPGQTVDIPVLTASDQKNGIPSMPGRLVAMRKSPADARKSREELIKVNKKKGKNPKQAALCACEYIILFTTLGPVVPAADILELYRFRWQVELAFKRMKSLIRLDEMAAQDDRLCRTFILGKLLAVLLIEDLIHQMGSFPPCGHERSAGSSILASV